MRKRDDKGLETPEAIVSKGIIRTDLTSISSICMTYTPFSYVSGLGGTRRYGSTVGYKCAFGHISRAYESKSVKDRNFPRSLDLVARCIRHDHRRHCTSVSNKNYIDASLHYTNKPKTPPLCRSYNLITTTKTINCVPKNPPFQR